MALFGADASRGKPRAGRRRRGSPRARDCGWVRGRHGVARVRHRRSATREAWNHAAICFDGAFVRVYVDGILRHLDGALKLIAPAATGLTRVALGGELPRVLDEEATVERRSRRGRHQRVDGLSADRSAGACRRLGGSMKPTAPRPGTPRPGCSCFGHAAGRRHDRGPDRSPPMPPLPIP